MDRPIKPAREPWEPLESLDWAKIMRMADAEARRRKYAMEAEIEVNSWRFKAARV